MLILYEGTWALKGVKVENTALDVVAAQPMRFICEEDDLQAEIQKRLDEVGRKAQQPPIPVYWESWVHPNDVGELPGSPGGPLRPESIRPLKELVLSEIVDVITIEQLGKCLYESFVEASKKSGNAGKSESKEGVG